MTSTTAFLCSLLLLAANLSYGRGQATETWVSGVGDDVNPCSRTAPCKTYSGAIAKTVANGEIDTLDPGNFGDITIIKSITIDGGAGNGYVVVPSSNDGFVISGPTDNAITVVLRNLQLQGAGQANSGIKILNAASVYLENVKITGFITAGIEIAIPTNTSAMQVFISNSDITKNTVGIQVGTNGTTSPYVQVSIDQTTISQSSTNGIQVFSGKVVVSNSIINQNNNGVGVLVLAEAELDLFNNQFNFNNLGLEVGANSTVKLVGNDFSLNTVDIQCSAPLALESGNVIVGATTANGCVAMAANQTKPVTVAPPVSAASTLGPSFLHALLTFFANQ